MNADYWYRLVARDNALTGQGDVFKGGWFMTAKDAVSDFEMGPNRWMRWSFGLLIERHDGLRMWVHSLGENHES